MKKTVVMAALGAMIVIATAPLFARGQEAGGGSGPVTVNVAFANNPISQALARIAQSDYKAAGVTVNISVLPENDLRQRLTTEASTGGTTYDIFFIGPYEAQTWAQKNWLENLEPYFDKLPADRKAWYDRADLIKGMADSVSLDGKAYGLPFYGESSFIMYNKDLFAAKGLTMPDEPTWDEIYELAKQIHDPSKGVVGMTMRGTPGWGMSGAPFVTMVNAFGGRFFDMQWNATVNTPEQRKAWEMYKKILREAGQPDILSYTYNECIALMSSGNCGIYYDATSIAPPLEANDSKVKGKLGYVMAPHDVLNKNNAWLWNWTMGLNPKASAVKKQAAFEFMLWATSKEYIAKSLVLDPTGSSTPPASRSSTYKLPAYASVPYGPMTLKTLEGMDFTKPCLEPVPYVGLQYIAIPEFADAGDIMTRNLADYVVDNITLDVALQRTQATFEQVAKDGQYKK
ncbi:MAG: sugar ABC transporter substrate-binding protein [Treponema sp.]|jgi:sorbitol/mannitol transport system substrate-binding protein|nr:sugar ABC transporter substrate-binding protein [Treponema sp.]